MASLDYNPELRTIRLGDLPMAPGTPSSHEDGQPPFPSAQPIHEPAIGTSARAIGPQLTIVGPR